MKLWVDDIRPAPQGYDLARSVNMAIDRIMTAEKQNEPIEVIDLDHDLGEYYVDGGDAINVLDWLAERETYYPIAIHTANPVGRANMMRLISRHWK